MTKKRTTPQRRTKTPLIPTTPSRKPRSCYTADGKPKLRFDTRAEAKAWEQELLRRHPNNKILGQYRCDFCGYFHNGAYPSDPDAREGKRRRAHESSPPPLDGPSED